MFSRPGYIPLPADPSQGRRPAPTKHVPLPDELWVDIFYQYLVLFCESEFNRRLTHAPWGRPIWVKLRVPSMPPSTLCAKIQWLALVCRRWNNIISSTPTLWSLARITLEPKQCKVDHIVISRTRGTGLRLFTSEDQLGLNDASLLLAKQILSATFESLATSLSVFSFTGTVALTEHLIRAILPRLPRLATLYLGVDRGGYHGASYINTPAWIDLPPEGADWTRLRSLGLSGFIPKDCNSEKIGGLVDLSIEVASPPSGVDAAADALPIPILIKILQTCSSSLETLLFIGNVQEVTEANVYEPPISLPRLKQLDILYCEPGPRHVISLISAPADARLYVGRKVDNTKRSIEPIFSSGSLPFILDLRSLEVRGSGRSVEIHGWNKPVVATTKPSWHRSPFCMNSPGEHTLKPVISLDLLMSDDSDESALLHHALYSMTAQLRLGRNVEVLTLVDTQIEESFFFSQGYTWPFVLRSMPMLRILRLSAIDWPTYLAGLVSEEHEAITYVHSSGTTSATSDEPPVPCIHLHTLSLAFRCTAPEDHPKSTNRKSCVPNLRPADIVRCLKQRKDALVSIPNSESQPGTVTVLSRLELNFDDGVEVMEEYRAFLTPRLKGLVGRLHFDVRDRWSGRVVYSDDEESSSSEGSDGMEEDGSDEIEVDWEA